MPKSAWLSRELRGFGKLSTLIFVLLVLQLAGAPNVLAVQNDAERRQALQLFKEGRFTDALPLFEKIAKEFPEDSEVMEKYGLVVIGQAAHLKDPKARKDARKRGRDILVKAQKIGAASALLKTLLERIPEDGGDDSGYSYSTKKEVEDAMKEGEAAFGKHDYPKAIEMYQKALLLDPNLYEAALYTGDVYFASAEQRKAGEWFARAVAINPDRETAYRYWGDSLMKQGRVTEAGDKFVEAFIAEPYNRLAANGFSQWGQKSNIRLAHPKVEIPANVTSQQNGSATISIDPNSLKDDDKSGSGAAWVTYGLVRATWQSEFAKQYPNEKTYRHSLKEETAALRAALKVLSEVKNPDAATIDPSLKVVAKLDKEGLLEAYILLAIPDAGIARDFAGYRKENIQKLRQYVTDYVMTGGMGKN